MTIDDILTPETKAVMRRHEGLNQPFRWPGGSSGITLGYGYDLAHHTKSEFIADWSVWLKSSAIDRLVLALGKSGKEADNSAGYYRDIVITPNAAMAVFRQRSAPKYWERTKLAFPGVERLSPRAAYALFSLVYNRGPDTDENDPRRIEMDRIEKILADGVQTGDLQKMADQLRGMKRLWKGKGLQGLIDRREDEARLIESCIPKEDRI